MFIGNKKCRIYAACGVSQTPRKKIINSEVIIMKLSARNQLKGKVVSINNGAVNSIVSIDIGGGNIITATISCAAVEELNLKVGSDAYAVIKATNVMVGIDE